MDPSIPTEIGRRTNAQLLQAAVGNDDLIVLSVHPDVVRNAVPDPASTTFLQEVDYLESMGYQVSPNPTTFTKEGVTYSLYTMEKIS